MEVSLARKHPPDPGPYFHCAVQSFVPEVVESAVVDTPDKPNMANSNVAAGTPSAPMNVLRTVHRHHHRAESHLPERRGESQDSRHADPDDGDRGLRGCSADDHRRRQAGGARSAGIPDGVVRDDGERRAVRGHAERHADRAVHGGRVDPGRHADRYCHPLGHPVRRFQRRDGRRSRPTSRSTR